MLDWMNAELLNEDIVSFMIFHSQEDRAHESLKSHVCEGSFYYKDMEVFSEKEV